MKPMLQIEVGAQGSASAQVPAGQAPAAIQNPASNPAPSVDPTQPPAAAPINTDWVNDFPDDLRGYIANKKFQTPKDVAESYRNLEKLARAGEDKLARIPDRDDDADGFNALYDKLGRPKEAKEYEFKLGEFGGDEKIENFFRETFHKTGLNKKQAAQFVAEWNGVMENAMKEQNEAQSREIETQINGLKKEWGPAYDQKVQQNAKVLERFGLKAEEAAGVLDALDKSAGFAKTMKFLDAIAQGMGEENFVGGQSGGKGGALSPQQAKDKLEGLKQDPLWTERYMRGEPSAREEAQRLMKMANPDL